MSVTGITPVPPCGDAGPSAWGGGRDTKPQARRGDEHEGRRIFLSVPKRIELGGQPCRFGTGKSAPGPSSGSLPLKMPDACGVSQAFLAQSYALCMLILALNYLAAQLLMEYAQMANEFKARLTIQRANRIFVNVHENVTDRRSNLAPQGSAARLTLCARRRVSDTAARRLPHWRYGHHNRLGVRDWPGVCYHRVHCGANRVAGVLQGRAEAS